jgi:hypothetical protein
VLPIAQHYALWATPVLRFMNLLEQTDYFTVFEFDAVCGWNLWKSWHGHDVSSDHNNELGTRT